MTPPVKLRTMLRRRCSFVFFGIVITAGVIAAPRDPKVTLWKNSPMPLGTVIRETREIRGENGKRTTTDDATKNANSNAMRYVHRVSMVRRLVGTDRIEVSVRDCVRECLFFTAGMAPPSNEFAMPISALDLRMRRVSGRWVYELETGKPSDAQKFALGELGQFSDLLGVLALCISPQPRAKGETWKVDQFPKPPGRGYGYVMPEFIECRLEDVVTHPDGDLARIGVTGKLKVDRPLGVNGSMSITFAGTFMHRLTDMLDVETNLTGEFTYTGPVMADGKPAKALIELPWTLKRTQKIEPK
jgi:hypothetical protein